MYYKNFKKNKIMQQVMFTTLAIGCAQAVEQELVKNTGQVIHEKKNTENTIDSLKKRLAAINQKYTDSESNSEQIKNNNLEKISIQELEISCVSGNYNKNFSGKETDHLKQRFDEIKQSYASKMESIQQKKEQSLTALFAKRIAMLCAKRYSFNELFLGM